MKNLIFNFKAVQTGTGSQKLNSEPEPAPEPKLFESRSRATTLVLTQLLSKLIRNKFQTALCDNKYLLATYPLSENLSPSLYWGIPVVN
jgi:hypothetical protein